MSEATGSFYLVLRRDYRHSRRVQAVKVTMRPPTVLDAGDIVVKLNINVPLTAFQPFEANVVNISEKQIQSVEVSQA